MNALTILFFLVLTTFIRAAPLDLRDVVSPPILTPTANTVWNVGETQTVTWNTSAIPAQESNPIGELVLGYLENGSENLMLSSPLASNIPLQNGQVQITVPSVSPRNDYIVCLIGDSGNISPQFTINGGSASSAGSSTPASTSSPVTTVTATVSPAQTVTSLAGSPAATTLTSAVPGSYAASSTSTSSTFTVGSPADSGTPSSPSSPGAATPSASTSAAWRLHNIDGSKLYSVVISVSILFALL